jgi:prepilin-type processing-associated H-X9-DG protein
LTVVEVIVAIAIIGLLMALVLPAVQSAREASRNIQCRSNLRQLGLASQNYLSTHGVFPRASYGGWFSVFVGLLPDLEQSSVFDQVDFSKSSFDQPKLYRLRPKVLACPSDPVVWRYPWRPSYHGNYGWLDTGTSLNEAVKFHTSNGVIITRSLRPNDIRDGLSQTALFAEALPSGDSNPKRLIWKDSNVLEVRPGAALAARCLTSNVVNRNASRGAVWTYAPPGQTLYDHILPPNSKSCNYVHTGGSLHPGGMNVAFCDGSARFVNDSVDATLWRSLGTRNGGESIGGF